MRSRACHYALRRNCRASVSLLHRELVGIEQSRSEMVPGKIFNHAFSCRRAHPFDQLRMIVEMLDGGSERINIRGWDNDSFDPIVNHVACFARRNLGQCASGGFIGDLRASLTLRREHVHRSLPQIFFDLLRKSDDFNIIAPEAFQVMLGFLMKRAD